MTDPSGSTVADAEREWARTPAFPVVTAELAADYGRVDGHVVQPRAGQSVRAVVVDTVAGRARELRGEQGRVRARVSAVDAADGGEFLAVVTADGQVIDATSRAAGPQSGTSAAWWRRWWVLGLVLLLVLVTGGLAWAGIALWHQPDAESSAGAATTSSSTLRPGTRTVVPERPPGGFSSVARWSAAVEDRSQPVLTPSGLVVSRTEDTVRAHRLSDGARVWQDSVPADVSQAESGGLQLTRVAGRWSVALAGDDELSWWPLRGDHTRQHVELPDHAEVSFAGRSPLVTVPAGHVRVVTNQQRLSDRVVPPSATALAADGGTAVATDTDGHTWQLTADTARFPGESESLDAPDGAEGTPRVLGMAGQHVLAVWPATKDGDRDKKHRVVALHEPASGEVVLSDRVEADGIKDADWLSSPADSRFGALGNVVIDAHRSSMEQLADFDTDRVVPGGVYGQQDEHAAVVARGTKEPADVGGDLAPVARTGQWALLISAPEQTQQARMFAVPARETDAPRSTSGEHGPTDQEHAGHGSDGAGPTPTSKTTPDTPDSPDDGDEPTPTSKEGE